MCGSMSDSCNVRTKRALLTNATIDTSPSAGRLPGERLEALVDDNEVSET